MLNYKHLWIFAFTLHISVTVYCRWLEVRLPKDVPQREGYLCTYEHLPRGTTYALKFIPRPFHDTAERILLFGCSSPRQFQRYWDCNRDVSPCENEGEENLIFAWTKNVKTVELPENVGFKLGHHTKSKYIVMQVYYSKLRDVDRLLMLNNVQDSMYGSGGGDATDGIDIYLSTIWQKYLASVYSFSSKEFKVPNNSQEYHIDIGCGYHGKRIAPFAYCCEASSYNGLAVMAYRIRDGSWALIAKADPHDPPGFYPIADADMMVIKPGDYLALRCVYNMQNTDGSVELSDKNETCHFYFMYYMLNKNIPAHQFEEQCDSVMQNVMSFPSKGNATTAPSTKSPTTVKPLTIMMNTTAILEASKTDSTIQSVSSETSTKPTLSSNEQINSQLTPSPSLRSVKLQPEIGIEPSYVGPKPSILDDWVFSNNSVGPICGIDLFEDNLVALHHGSRNLSVYSFDDEHYYTDHEKPIKENTIIHIDPLTGEVTKSFGQNIFYFPHSLTVDDNGNYWITDIGLHQVIKFSSSNTDSPSLTLGIAAIPGSDDNHFCKPTDVAIDKHGNIFVADGYCNSRIMKFNKNGILMKKWGSAQNVNDYFKTGHIVTPHSLSIDGKMHHLYVSDFQNGNIIKFDTEGNVLRVIKHVNVDGKLFSMDFNPAFGGIMYTLHGLYKHGGSIVHIISTKTGRHLTKWNIMDKNINRPYDIAISKDNSILYMSVDSILLKFKIDNPKELLQNMNNFGNTIISDNDPNHYSEIKIIKPIEDGKSVLPAVIVVTILAIPVFLAVVSMLVQHIRLKWRHNKVSMVRLQKHRFWNQSSNEILCYGCCITRKHYYDGNRGMGNFMAGTDEESDCDEEDLFTGKA